MTGVSKNTVTKLLMDMGTACAVYQDQTLVHLPCSRIQVDEIWNFVGLRKKMSPKARKAGAVCTWTAINADTKLAPAWLVGGRDADYANEFIMEYPNRNRSGTNKARWCKDPKAQSDFLRNQIDLIAGVAVFV